MKKRLFGVVTIMVSLLFSLVGYAANANPVVGETFTIIDGEISDDAVAVAVDEYLETKVLDSAEFASSISDLGKGTIRSTSRENDTFMADATRRNEAFREFERILDVEFVDVEISSFVEEIVSRSANQIVLNVYESTMIEYYASEEVTDTDVMGYGTDHVMVLERVGDTYCVVADSYDERFITGACSTDLMQTPIFQEDVVKEVTALTTESTTATPRSSFNVNSAINYANQWCGVAGSKTYADSGNGVYEGEDDDARYNSAYYHSAQSYADCANYVSQCLHAAGWGYDGTWTPHTSAWNTAKGLHLYLKGKGYNVVGATESTVFPGNPVYWWNGSEGNINDNGGKSSTGHQMICVGYNAAGVPVLNGHTDNMFRVPMTYAPITTLANQGSGLKTAQIVTSDQHTHVLSGSYIITATQHASKCKHCRSGFNYTAHTYVTSGTSKYCSVCGYTVN